MNGRRRPRAKERCTAVGAGFAPISAERGSQPALELPVEFPSRTVTEGAVKTARERIR